VEEDVELLKPFCVFVLNAQSPANSKMLA